MLVANITASIPRAAGEFPSVNTTTTPSLRERKKAQTRRAIQDQALRLFLAKGYDATTIEEISAAAGVSHMTFFRYFPSKEDAVLADDYDPLLAELIAARPGDERPVEKVTHALADGLERIYATDRDSLLARTRLILRTPPLRARQWEQQIATERLIVRALTAGPDCDESDLRLHVIAATCVAAITTAARIWVESDGARELPELIDQAFAALRHELGGEELGGNDQ